MRTIIVCFLFILISAPLTGQVIQEAPADKAVVYFVRTVEGFGMFASTYVLCENDPIGMLTYRTFIRYECEPGKQVFWVVRGNLSEITFTYYKQFIEAELLAGKIYLIEVRVQFEGISMEPVDPIADFDRMDRIKSVLNSKSSLKANKILKKKDYYKKRIHESFAKQGMEKYPKFVEKGKVQQLYPDWFIEPEDLIIKNSDLDI